ncbi:MAG: ABC transporter ATP-binding protein [Lachnospiraceae bacterium]|nr:ABC transporter ATP-binding protein [Lachnospiraceae bacterium]
MATFLRMSFQLLAPAASLTISLIARRIINLLSGGGEEAYDTLMLMMVLLLLTEIVLTVAERTDRHVRTVHEERIDKQASDMLMRKALECDLSEYDNPDFYDAMVLAERNTYAIHQMIWDTVRVFGAVYSFLLTFILLAGARLYYGFLLVLSVFPAAVVSVFYTRRVYALQLRQTTDSRKATYSRQVSFDRTYAQQIRIFALGKMLREKYSALWNRMFVERKRLSARFTLAGCVTECLPEIVSVVIGFDVSLSVLRGDATVGDYTFYIGLLAQSGVALQTLIGTVSSIYDNRLRLECVMKLETLAPQVRDCGTETLEQIQSITFRDVSFAYPGSDTDTLSHISFHIDAPEKVCITGHNGSGKSTLIKLLLRLYDPTGGEILINNRDIRIYRLSSLREMFSVYLQEMRCFMYSIRDNFLMVDPDRPDAEEMMFETLERTGCNDIMNMAANDLEICLSKMFDRRGLELSAGQYQKLSVARAFFRRFTVFIMDEPSSNLDRETEQRVFETVNQYADDRIVLCVSHRPETFRGVTRILNLNGGCLTESVRRQGGCDERT